ncbi:MAG: hypothetical protein QXR17_08525 [Candidatus Bathyarchaeia archaeon]
MLLVLPSFLRRSSLKFIGGIYGVCMRSECHDRHCGEGEAVSGDVSSKEARIVVVKPKSRRFAEKRRK